jgi:hypothetical protein
MPPSLSSYFLKAGMKAACAFTEVAWSGKTQGRSIASTAGTSPAM